MTRYIMVLAILNLVCPAAWGYIDPGTSSLLLQLQLAFAAGILFQFKKIWAFFTGVFRKFKATK